VIDRRSLILAAGAGIAQIGQRVLPRLTLPQLLDQTNVPALGGAVITPKGIVGLEAQGRRRSGVRIPVTNQDLWLIGSNTQAMTAALYARLAETGRVKWGAKVPELFPDIQVDGAWENVGVEELMAHVAGVSDEPFATEGALHKWLTDTRPITVQRTAFAKAILTAPPAGRRGDYVFSNAGYVIVGAAIERATKMDWETSISGELFGPLSLDSAGFGAPTGEEPWGHARIDAKHNLQVNPAAEADDPPVFGPASRVHLSLEDYAKFVRLFLTNGGDYLQPRSLAHIASPIVDDPTGPAPGWLVTNERSWAQGPVLTQRSSSGYWSSTALIGPAKGLAVIAVCNAGGADFGGAAVERLALSLIQKFALKP
jgi:D-alanyl-D-alanine carboxypeptidase